MKQIIIAIGVILTIFSSAVAQYLNDEGLESPEPISLFARSRTVRQGYGGGGGGDKVVAQILPIQQGSFYGGPQKQVVETLPNYGGSSGIDSGFGYNKEDVPSGGGGGFGQFGPAPGPNGIPPSEYQNQGFAGSGGGYNNQPQILPIQQTGGGGYGGQQQLKPVKPIQPSGGYGNQQGYRRPHSGGGHRQPSYGSGNGISFGNTGGSSGYGGSQQTGPAGSYGGQQQVGPAPGFGSNYGGSHPIQQQKPGQGYNQAVVEVDSYSQPPVIPQGGGYGPVAPPAQQAPIGYGR